MIIHVTIMDINPREDQFEIIERVRGYLNACDPSDRLQLDLSYPEN